MHCTMIDTVPMIRTADERCRDNRKHQQYSQSLVAKSGNINLSSWQGTKPTLKQWKTKENHNIKSELAQKQYGEGIFCEYNKTNHTSVKFYCFTSSYVPNLRATSMVPELTTRDCEHCWWSLFPDIICLVAVALYMYMHHTAGQILLTWNS